MRVLFDFSLAADDVGGPRTVMDGLLRGWAEAHPQDTVTVFGPRSLRAGARGAPFHHVEPRLGLAPRRVLQQQVELPLRRLARRVDAVIVPNLACSVTGLGRPIVGTLNDVRHLRRPLEFPVPSRVFRNLVWTASARRMAAVASISEFSLREAEDLGLPLPRLRAVVPLGSDHVPADVATRKTDTVVCVAHRVSKGLGELPAIWAAVRAGLGSGCPELVVTGVGPAQRASVEDGLAAAGVVDRVTLVPFLAPRAFYTAIAEARAALYLSTYEGFGLVPTEATALGTHCFAYDLPPYRERAHQLALTSVAVGDRQAMARALVAHLGGRPPVVALAPPARWADVADAYRALAVRAVEARRR